MTLPFAHFVLQVLLCIQFEESSFELKVFTDTLYSFYVLSKVDIEINGGLEK